MIDNFAKIENSFSNDYDVELNFIDNKTIKLTYYTKDILTYENLNKLIFNYTVEEFIKKVEPALWSDSKIDTYCKFDQKEGGDSTDNNKDDDDKNLYHSMSDKTKSEYKNSDGDELKKGRIDMIRSSAA